MSYHYRGKYIPINHRKKLDKIIKKAQEAQIGIGADLSAMLYDSLYERLTNLDPTTRKLKKNQAKAVQAINQARSDSEKYYSYHYPSAPLKTTYAVVLPVPYHSNHKSNKMANKLHYYGNYYYYLKPSDDSDIDDLITTMNSTYDGVRADIIAAFADMVTKLPVLPTVDEMIANIEEAREAMKTRKSIKKIK